MLARLFEPVRKVFQRVSPGYKNGLFILGALSLMVGFGLEGYYFESQNLLLLYLLIFLLLLWVYLYSANIYHLQRSLSLLKKSLLEVSRGRYSRRIEALSIPECAFIHEDINNILCTLDKKNTFLQEYKKVVDASALLVKTDVHGKITYVNKAYEHLSGYSLVELTGNSHALVRSQATTNVYLEAFWNTILNKEVFTGEFENQAKNGETFFVESTVVPIVDEAGEIFEFISIMFDITEHKKQALALEEQLYIDTLTGLPNRKALHDAIEMHYSHKLMLINIDSFSTINTIYGEAVGDGVIVALGEKLKKLVHRESLTLYYHGGDEFAVLADEKTPSDFFKEDTILIAHQLNPIELVSHSHNINVRVRIGVAQGTKSGNHRSLISMASLAMREAQKSKQAYAFYSEVDDDVLHLEQNLLTLEIVEEALKYQGVKLHFQAIANTKKHEVEKFEALVRIVDREGVMHYPNSFIEIAKGARLYSKLSREVFRQTLEAAQKNPLYEFSFNIEMSDILDARTRRYILESLRASHCAERIVFELVESEALENNDVVFHFFQLIKAEGSKIAIDDFGSGYSNYAYLMKLGVDIVKIDGSLVADITTNLDNKRIVMSIINIIHELGMQVVTEYIENKETYQMVLLLGADYAQGHFIEKATGIDATTLLE